MRISDWSSDVCSSDLNANQDNSNNEVVQDTASLTQVWKTDSTFTGSESTLYNPANNTIYVSCGNTDPSAKDGDGFIALLNPDGSEIGRASCRESVCQYV